MPVPGFPAMNMIPGPIGFPPPNIANPFGFPPVQPNMAVIPPGGFPTFAAVQAQMAASMGRENNNRGINSTPGRGGGGGGGRPSRDFGDRDLRRPAREERDNYESRGRRNDYRTRDHDRDRRSPSPRRRRDDRDRDYRQDKDYRDHDYRSRNRGGT